MKTIQKFIKESLYNIDKYYQPIDKLKNGEEIFVGYLDDDNKAMPMKVKVDIKDDVRFIMPGAHKERSSYLNFINIDKPGEDTKIAIGGTFKEMSDICNFYNDHNK